MKRIVDLFTENDRFILSIIIVNTITIFLEGFKNLPDIFYKTIIFIDASITVLFIIEAILKIKRFTWKDYISSNWNKLDFILVVLSIPSLILPLINHQEADLSFLLVFRISRVFKFIRFFKFIPGITDLAKGVRRALKTSVVVLIGFVIFNFVISVLSCYLFKDISSKLFGDPVTSFYSTFRVFTVEGWYEIPEILTQNLGDIQSFFIKLYFIIILVTGGILGLSLVNSIFVDSMVSDNNDELLDEVKKLSQKVDKLTQELEDKKKSE